VTTALSPSALKLLERQRLTGRSNPASQGPAELQQEQHEQCTTLELIVGEHRGVLSEGWDR
jgi:hypothetical protein